MTEETSGRVMTVLTDLPGVQFYAGNCISRTTGRTGQCTQKEADLRLKPSITRILPMNRDFRLQYLDLTGHMIQ